MDNKFNLFVHDESLMDNSTGDQHKKSPLQPQTGPERGESDTREAKRDPKLPQKIGELREALAQVKADMNQEQIKIFNIVKTKTNETRLLKKTMLDEFEGISEIFENYFRLFDKKQKMEEEYYSLKRDAQGSKGGKSTVN